MKNIDLENNKLVMVYAEDKEASVVIVPNSFYKKIIDKYGDFDDFYLMATESGGGPEGREANDLMYDDTGGKQAFCGFTQLKFDDTFYE